LITRLGFHRLLHGQISGIFALESPACIEAGQMIITDLSISAGALRLQLDTVKILGGPTDGPEPFSSAMEFASIALG